MGVCASNDDDGDGSNNSSVNNELLRDKGEDQKIKKLLFLGPGGSGKSTFFKQLKMGHCGGFTEDDRTAYRNHIYGQIIEQMKELMENVDELLVTSEFREYSLSDDAKRYAEFIDNCRGDSDVTSEIANAVEALWTEDAVQAVFAIRARLNRIEDSSQYFFDDVQRIAEKPYTPTDRDILMVRHRTTGVVTQKFEMSGKRFHIFDVGGQRSERRKWIHCFENVTAVIFVISLNCYDEKLFEDDNVNTMHDALELFTKISNQRWFENTSIILFMNKKDLFAEKITRVSLSECWPDFGGTPYDYDEAIVFIKQKFIGQAPRNKDIHAYVTTATAPDNVERVFQSVTQIVLKQNLAQVGLGDMSGGLPV